MFVDSAQQCFAFTPQANFPAHNLNLHKRWWDQIKATFQNVFYFNTLEQIEKHQMINFASYLFHCEIKVIF